MSVIKGRKVRIKWISKSREHYENKGYVFTKWYDEFDVNVEDLSSGASVLVDYICDNPECNRKFSRKYCNVTRSDSSFCSRKCKDLIAKRQLYTIDMLTEEFWKFYYKHGRYPNSIDYKNDKTLPSVETVSRRFGSWDNYLKEIGVVEKDSQDGWYIHDEAILRKYYPKNDIETIVSKLMIKRIEQSIRMKANSMGLQVEKEIRYHPKYKNKEVRQQLKNEAVLFFKENGRSPYRFELSLPRNAIEQNWDSYNEFLTECKLPIYRREVELKSKEDGIEFLRELNNKLNRVPNIYDANEYGVHKNWFMNIFGGFTQALYEAKLIERIDADSDYRLEESLNQFKKLYTVNNRPPTYIEYREYSKENNVFAPNSLMKYAQVKSYTELCMKVFGEANINDYDKSEMIESLKELKLTLGRVPMGIDLVPNGLPSLVIFKTVFKERYFNDILRNIGWEPFGHDPMYKTDEELLEDFHKLYEQLNRVPNPEEINLNKNMCSSATYISRFGSIFNVCDLLGIDYTKSFSFSELSAGTICFDKNRELCRSIPEMIITNLFIDNGIKYIKEVYYEDIIGRNKDKRRLDWYLPKYNLCIEYFGFFDLSRKDSKCRVGEYTRKALRKINDLKNNGIELLSLFPEDTKDDYQGTKEKIKQHIKHLQTT